MLTGLSLTSCGGGGGGGNLAGTVLYMAANGYQIIFNEQVDGVANTYEADITDLAGDHYTRVVLWVSGVQMDDGKLSSATGAFSAACYRDSDYPRLLVRMFGTEGEPDVESVTVGAGAKFTLTAKDGDTIELKWEFAETPYWVKNGENVKNPLIAPAADQTPPDGENEVNGGTTATHEGSIRQY
jgi:hypothetical protein